MTSLVGPLLSPITGGVVSGGSRKVSDDTAAAGSHDGHPREYFMGIFKVLSYKTMCIPADFIIAVFIRGIV